MGPLHCQLCIGLALLSVLRTAAHGLLLARIAGIGSRSEADPIEPILGPLLAH